LLLLLLPEVLVAEPLHPRDTGIHPTDGVFKEADVPPRFRPRVEALDVLVAELSQGAGAALAAGSDLCLQYFLFSSTSSIIVLIVG
jgi:hypothetical protein